MSTYEIIFAVIGVVAAVLLFAVSKTARRIISESLKHPTTPSKITRP